jgi:hypothetical protein
MSINVLGGLEGYRVELYLDDVSLWIHEGIILIESQVMERFEKHNITLNQRNADLGYVGHVIDQHGTRQFILHKAN